MIKKHIEILRGENKSDLSKKALELLSKSVDSKTLLLLSGGSSPKFLYQLISKGEKLHPGAIALIDERFGIQMHENSNEKMIFETGLIDYINNEGIPFFRILTSGTIEEQAYRYEKVIAELFKKFTRKVAIMGIGSDGHTAGIKPELNYDHKRLVVGYEDTNGSFGKRITLTFEVLSQINEFIILAFGENKKEALTKMFKETDKQKNPAVFYVQTTAQVLLLN